MPHNLPDRLRAEANAIDDTGDYELRCLLLEAAGAIDDAISMRSQIVNRLPGDIAQHCDTWFSTLSAVSRLKTERNNAIEEVERLKVQNARLRSFLEDRALPALQLAEADYPLSAQAKMAALDCGALLQETPTQSLADIQARAVEAILKDLRADVPDTNTARRIFQRLQLRVDVLRAKQPITNPTENSSQLVIGDSNGDHGGSGYDREVLGQNNVALTCWSCSASVSHSSVDEADGHCPNCDVEIDRGEGDTV